MRNVKPLPRGSVQRPMRNYRRVALPAVLQFCTSYKHKVIGHYYFAFGETDGMRVGDGVIRSYEDSTDSSGRRLKMIGLLNVRWPVPKQRGAVILASFGEKRLRVQLGREP